MTQRILAVDDEPHMLRLLERIVAEKTPHSIVTLSNSLELPGILANQEFDLIITDLKMPGMDGMDVLHYIREHQREEAVIIMTAFGSLDSALEALELGVFDYITKPFKKEQMIFAVDRALQWQGAKREARELAELADTEPYDAARKRFDLTWVERLAVRCQHKRDEMQARSGLDEATLQGMLDRLAAEKDTSQGGTQGE
ncbi:response regulator [candidate division GN15 bacterium]|nr:response regulator [candidate division GN15 bacterium]